MNNKEIKKAHLAKVRFLAEDLVDKIVEVAERKYNSGAIDPTDYRVDCYGLAKVLLTASLPDVVDVYAPLSDEMQMDVKNLKNF
jgi:hypothetical protein